MISELLTRAVEMIAGGGAQTGVAVTLAVAALYARKALGLGALAANWMRMVAFTLGVLAVGLVTGVIPAINVEALVGLVSGVIDTVRLIVEFVLSG